MPASTATTASGYTIVEQSDEWIVVQITGVPSQALALAIAEIDTSIIPIVLAKATGDETRIFFHRDQFVVVEPTFEVHYGTTHKKGRSANGALKLAKGMLTGNLDTED